LNDASSVTQVDEDDAPMVSATMDPASENDLIAYLGVHHVSAAMAAAHGSHSIELDTLRAHQDSRANGLIPKSIRIIELMARHDIMRWAGEASERKNRFEIGELDSNSTDHCQSTEGTEASVQECEMRASWAYSSGR
jgi:hypothetical protein